MGIQRKESVGMIQDYNESVAFQPVRVDDRPGHDRVNETAFHGPDLDAFALHIGIEGRVLLPTEIRNDAAVRRPGQTALRAPREEAARRGSGRRGPSALLELTEEAVDPGSRPLQFLK